MGETAQICELCRAPLESVDGIERWGRCSRPICHHFQRIRAEIIEKTVDCIRDYVPPPINVWERFASKVFPMVNASASHERNRKEWDDLYLPEAPGRLLGIGMGDLELFSKAANRGWQTSVFHPDAGICSKWKEKGLAVRQGMPNWGDLADGCVDAVVLRWCLEQISDVEECVKNAWRTVANRGRLVIVCWNANSYGREVCASRWLPFCLSKYLRIFTPAGLRYLASRTGVVGRHVIFTSSAGQIPQTFPIEKETCKGGELLQKRAFAMLEESPMSGEATVFVAIKE